MDQPPSRPEFPPGPEEYASGGARGRPERPAPIAPPVESGIGAEERAALAPPPGRDPRTPGGPVAGGLTWILLIVTTLFVFAMQSGLVSLTPPPPEEEVPSPDGLIQIMGRYNVGATRMLSGMQPPAAPAAESEDGEDAEDDGVADPEDQAVVIGLQLLQQMDTMFPATANRLRLAMVAGETVAPEEAIRRIDELLEDARESAEGEEPVEAPAWLVEDSATLRLLYLDGADAISDQQREDLVERHGWFGELALVNSADDDDPLRKEILGSSTRFLVLIITVFFGVGLAGLAGLVTLIVVSAFGSGRSLLTAGATIAVATLPGFAGLALNIMGLGFFGNWLIFMSLCAVMVGVLIAVNGGLKKRYKAPEAGGSAYLESFTMFLIWFPAVSVLGAIIAGAMGVDLTPILIWTLLLCAFFPLARGARWLEWKRAMGWHRGAGFFKEVLAGVFGYIAGLPIFALAVLITLVLGAAAAYLPGQESAGPPTHPIFEQLGGGDLWGVVQIYLLAAVWAPVVEETMFRGALYHHLRGALGVVSAALFSSFIFAFIHPQGIIAVPALMGLALVFALMREWRGSIIGPMVAHAMHNATLITILLIGLS